MTHPKWTQRLGLGKALYQLYHVPRRFLNQCRQQGIMTVAQDIWARQQMEQAVDTLPTLPAPTQDSPLEIYFLSGRRFWYQTCFCFYSLAQQSPLHLRPVIYDDGSLKPQEVQSIQRLFPQAQIVLREEIEQRLDQVLPFSRFPSLRSRRLQYPNLRKLTDIHAGGQGWKLVLDSDMLFFRPPTALLQWLQSPEQPCHMVDVETAYGYSEALMTELAQAPIPPRVNVGICGLQSDDLDWEELEFWCRTLIEYEGPHYYQEQALIAMLMARQSRLVVPAKDYIVMPDRTEVLSPEAILHHYVSDSKPWYFHYGWRHITRSHQLSEMLWEVAR